MLRVSIILVAISLIGLVFCDEPVTEVCFRALGCFSTLPPFRSPQRPIPYPSDPSLYDVNLVYFAANSNPDGIRVGLYPSIEPVPTHFDAFRPYTILILPGVGATSLTKIGWLAHMKDAILDKVDANVFIGNNTGETFTLDRFRAAADAPVVARHYSRILDHLKKTQGLEASRIWIIGFGLGAHIAGFVGKDTHVGRITGLDPVQELFEGQLTEIRLAKSDADFVDIIHTNARPLLPDLGIGIMEAIGHTDIYVNGANQQPGCKNPRPLDLIGYPTLIDSVRKPVYLFAEAKLCGHKLAHRVFTAALELSNCTIWGHPGTYENLLVAIANAGTDGALDQYTAFKERCDMEKCTPMGFDTPKSIARGVFVANTYGSYPYCMGDDVRKEYKESRRKQIGKILAESYHPKPFGQLKNDTKNAIRKLANILL